MSDLYDLGRAADDPSSFVVFLDALRQDLARELARPEAERAWGVGDWASTDLDGFLESLGAWLTAGGRPGALDASAWSAFAEMLLAARIYE